MRLPLGMRRTLHNVLHPSIFPMLGGPDVLTILKGVREDATVVTWEWPVELALRYHYEHLFRLTLRHVFRVRPNNGVVAFSLGAPPSKSVLAHGRLNEIGQSRFYAADNPVTAILETWPQPGEIVTLTMFGFRNYSSAARRTAQIMGMARYLSPDVEVEIGEVSLKYDFIRSIVHDFERFLAVDEWIADAITQVVPQTDVESYYPTIALGNMVLRDFGLPNALGLPGPRADALLYPSVASKLRAMNVCMEPKTAVATYAPERAWTLQFEGVDFNSAPPAAKVRLISQSKPIDHTGVIQWSTVDLAITRSLFAGALSTKAAMEFL